MPGRRRGPGLARRYFFADPETGVMVAEFLDGFETMTPAIFCR